MLRNRQRILALLAFFEESAGITHASARELNVASSFIFELVDTFAKSHASLRAHLPGFLTKSSCVPQISEHRTALLRFTLLIAPCDELFFARFYVVPPALGEFDGVMRPQFSPRRIDFSDGNLETHNPTV